MRKLFSFLDRLLEWISFVSIGGFTFLVFLQVVCRYIFKSPLHWQKEVCQYLLYVVVLSGAVLAVKNGSHVSVDLITQRLSPRRRTLLKAATYGLILICCLFITYSGVLYCVSVGNRRSDELRILIKYVYAMFPIFGALMSLYALYEIIETCKEFFNKGGGD